MLGRGMVSRHFVNKHICAKSGLSWPVNSPQVLALSRMRGVARHGRACAQGRV